MKSLMMDEPFPPIFNRYSSVLASITGENMLYVAFNGL